MKILGVCFNYPTHRDEAQSLGLGVQSLPHAEPVFFHKGDSLLRPNTPFFLPDMGSSVEYEAELVVQISRVGKRIAERFAHRYYNYITLGIDFTARDLQRRAMAEGHPWLSAKVFDGSAVVGTWLSKEELGYPECPIPFRLDVDGVTRQSATSSEMIHGIDSLISHISRHQTLRMGDLIFTGTPAGVGAVEIGQLLEGYIGERRVLHLPIK
nr:fumarylacetoacetate hydrolase family protein [uncultured Porphyromonas sp.]